MLIIATSRSVAVAESGPTLKVVEHTWGFDGRVQPGQFNPLSILLDNQTDEAIDASATLQRMQAVLNPAGGQYVQQVFIAPAARRWIQFYPYVANSIQTEWILSFDGERIGEFTQPRPAYKLDSEKEDQQPQVIILDKAGTVSSRPSTVKHLPENIFPPYATATFGLHTVFMDHVPDWELPRQQAFLSWLKLGGRLHLLKDRRGEYPRFSGELADLNQPLSRYSVGSGVVSRLDVQREGLTETMVRRAVVLDALKDEDEEFEEFLRQQKQLGRGVGQLIEIEPSSIDEQFFRHMRELTLPDHAWWLIFLLALCYIGLIFPGCFMLSRNKQLHFLATYSALVGLSVIFSILFLAIGQRGYGESTTLQTLAVARSEDNTHWSVMQWNALFVTSGDSYQATAPDQQSVYSTGETLDQADAQIVPGNNGGITMQIPPFSTQTFVSRRRLASADWRLQIRDIDLQLSGLVKLNIQTGANFPAAEANKYLVLAGRRLYEMKYDESTKQLILFGAKRRLAEYCQPNFDFQYVNRWNRQQEEDLRTPTERFYDESLPALVQRNLLDDLVNKVARYELPADRLRLFVYTAVPDEFMISVNAEAKSTGRILFAKDLFLRSGDPE
ncbi:MAG TPA: hypothetical protein EYG03_23180 [Planctomycetes bacterium]|nr:hypothetical protein [Fuerstiella sp.]HIK94859.1 hypothetical protein [Planctomycetota bacterium]